MTSVTDTTRRMARATEGAPPPDLHEGDEVAVLTEAKRPQVFKDEGAFDRRAYLAQQNIDLVATLRAPELVVRIASQTPTIGTVLARARRRLREEIDELFSSTPQAAGVCGQCPGAANAAASALAKAPDHQQDQKKK